MHMMKTEQREWLGDTRFKWRTVTIDVRLIELPKISDRTGRVRQLAIHESLQYSDRFTVSDYGTGRAIGHGGTRAKAIENATQRVSEYGMEAYMRNVEKSEILNSEVARL